MKRQDIRIFIAKTFMAIAICIPSLLNAQEYENTPVEVSKEKVRIDGQVCYSHIVLERQTLYSISKAYGVSIEDIYKYNPIVKQNGLKKNSIIVIPAVEEVMKKEDAADAEQATGVRKEQMAQKEAKTRQKTHIVKWFEDLEGIAAKYGVTAEAIMKANNLKGRKLSKRQKLTIPEPGEYEDIIITETDSTDFKVMADTLSIADSGCYEEPVFWKKEVDMSLLLPLKATGTSGSRQNMDFYSGILLAIYDMAKEGVSTNLEVYDVADGNMASAAGRIRNSDIVIGPISAVDITDLYELVPDIKAIVSPLDPKAGELVSGRESMIHVPTPHMIQYNDLVSWIKEEMKPEDRCLVITEKGARPSDAIIGMTAAIDSSGVEYSPLSYSILEGRNVTESLEYLMTETGTNRVYIASESEAFVNDVVRNLNLMIHKKYDVVLYAPSKIRSFETIEVENFHNASLHVSMGYYIDYDNAMVKSFLLKYRALFNTEPTQFAYQGYDIAKYFITMYSKYGNRWMDKLDEQKSSMLQSTFDFKKTEDGGHTNNGVRRIIYENGWKVRKVR